MKSCIIFFIVVFTSLGVYAQTDVPGTGVQTNILLNAIKALQLENVTLQQSVDGRISRMVEDMQKKASTEFIRDLKSMQRIMKLLESMYCQTAETSILLDIMGSNCLLDMEIEMALLNISYSQDIMKTSFLIGATLSYLAETSVQSTSSEKISFLEKVANSLERSINAFKNLNSGLRVRLDKQMVEKFLDKQEKNGIRISSFNRYNDSVIK
jgi:hypothetical protein